MQDKQVCEEVVDTSHWSVTARDVKILTVFAGAFFCVNMVLITLSSFLSATIINLYMRADKKNKVPDWLRMVCRLILRFFPQHIYYYYCSRETWFKRFILY